MTVIFKICFWETIDGETDFVYVLRARVIPFTTRIADRRPHKLRIFGYTTKQCYKASERGNERAGAPAGPRITTVAVFALVHKANSYRLTEVADLHRHLSDNTVFRAGVGLVKARIPRFDRNQRSTATRTDNVQLVSERAVLVVFPTDEDMLRSELTVVG